MATVGKMSDLLGVLSSYPMVRVVLNPPPGAALTVTPHSFTDSANDRCAETIKRLGRKNRTVRRIGGFYTQWLPAPQSGGDPDTMGIKPLKYVLCAKEENKKMSSS